MKRVSKIKKCWLVGLSLPFVGFGIWMYHRFDPLQHAIFPPCPFHYATDLYCPGCGSQRALHALLHGDIWGAIQHNFLLLLLFIVGLYKAYLILTKKSEHSSNFLYKNQTPWIVLLLVLSFWVLRNIPYTPFTFLAP